MSDDPANVPPSEPTESGEPSPISESVSAPAETPPAITVEQSVGESPVPASAAHEVTPTPTSSAPSPPASHVGMIPIVDAAARARAYASVQKKREKHLARIIDFVRKGGSIKNADIVRLLHISGATATRYLKTLVAREKLRQEGKGRGVCYRGL